MHPFGGHAAGGGETLVEKVHRAVAHHHVHFVKVGAPPPLLRQHVVEGFEKVGGAIYEGTIKIEDNGAG